MKHRNAVSFILYLAGFSSLMTLECSAYIDPASTSYMIQIIAGLCIAGGTAVGIFWSKLKRLFKKKDTSEPVMKSETSAGSEKKIITADDLLDGDEPQDNKSAAAEENK